MKHSGCPRGDLLIAYQDGDLPAAQQSLVDEHVNACPNCRAYLDDSTAIGQLLRAHFPLVADPAGVAAVKERMRQLPQPAPAQTARTSRWQPVVATCVLLLVVVCALQLQTSTADFRLGHFIGFIRDDHDAASEYVPANQQPPGTVVATTGDTATTGTLSFAAVRPEMLPLGLTLAEQSAPTADQLLMVYGRPDGTTIQVGEESARQSSSTFRADATQVEIVRGTEVGFEYALPGHVWHMAWERDGVVFAVVVTKEPNEGLTLEDAKSLVESLIIAQGD